MRVPFNIERMGEGYLRVVMVFHQKTSLSKPRPSMKFLSFDLLATEEDEALGEAV
jgi:hypothetical protein